MAIIFADDDDFVRDFAESMLESITSDVMVCEDGQEALQKLQSRGAAVKLVILDLNMPGMDGFTACQKMRAAGYKIPIIGFSAGKPWTHSKTTMLKQ